MLTKSIVKEKLQIISLVVFKLYLLICLKLTLKFILYVCVWWQGEDIWLLKFGQEDTKLIIYAQSWAMCFVISKYITNYFYEHVILLNENKQLCLEWI